MILKKFNIFLCPSATVVRVRDGALTE